MARLKGSKDKRKRVMSPSSLKNLNITPVTKGWASINPTIHLHETYIKEFDAMTPIQRGDVIAAGFQTRTLPAAPPDPEIPAWPAEGSPEWNEIREKLSQFTDMRRVQEIISTPIPEDQFILKGDIP